MEIVPGIHSVDGSVGCNTYLIIDGGITLVDTGLRGNEAHIYRYLEKIGKRPGDVKRIVITHAHLDHINCLHALKEKTGATVMASDGDAEIIEGTLPLHMPKGGFGPVFGLLGLFYHYSPAKVDTRLREGDLLPGAFDFRAVGLPGHSTGNIGLYSPSKKMLVSSDAIRVINGKMAMPSPRFTADMPGAIETIKKLGVLDFDILLPGHGIVVMADAARRVRELYSTGNVRGAIFPGG